MQTTERQDVSFGPLCTPALCHQQTSLFQAGRELMDFDGYGQRLISIDPTANGKDAQLARPDLLHEMSDNVTGRGCSAQSISPYCIPDRACAQTLRDSLNRYDTPRACGLMEGANGGLPMPILGLPSSARSKLCWREVRNPDGDNTIMMSPGHEIGFGLPTLLSINTSTREAA
jgi:hypothetical protein